MSASLATTDPATLDSGGAWLLDKIAERVCHLYFCGLRGDPVRVTHVVTLRGQPRAVTLDAYACSTHGRLR